MLKKIMVGLDKSQLSLQALEDAIALAKAYGAELRLVHILTDYEPGAPQRVIHLDHYYYPTMSQAVIEEYQREWNQFVSNFQAWLDGQVERAMRSGVAASSEMLLGDPARELCAAAKRWEADLVWVGSHGRSGLTEMFLGSVSNYVMHHAPCSVLISNNRKTVPLADKPSAKNLISV